MLLSRLCYKFHGILSRLLIRLEYTTKVCITRGMYCTPMSEEDKLTLTELWCDAAFPKK